MIAGVVEGFADRVVALPVPAGNYGRLSATDDALLFIRAGDDGNEIQRTKSPLVAVARM